VAKHKAEPKNGRENTMRVLAQGNLWIKIVGAAALVCVVVLPPFAYFNIETSRETLTNSFLERAKSIAHVLDASITDDVVLKDRDHMFEGLMKYLWAEPDVLAIDANVPKDGRLVTYVTTRAYNLNRPADADNRRSFETGDYIEKFVEQDGRRVLKVVTPINIARRHAGTIQIEFTTEVVDAKIFDAVKISITSYALLMILFAAVMYWVLRVIVVRPVAALNTGVKKVAAGDLEHRVEADQYDELGELALAFNQMAEELRKSERKLVETNKSLEAKVVERTTELLAEIQEHARVEKDLKRHQRMESLAGLAGGIAHNLNNLLQPIILLSAVGIEKLPKGSKLKEDLEVIREAGNRASELVNRLTEFSRENPVEMKRENLNEIVRESLQMIRASFPSSIEIKDDIDGFEAEITADATQLQTVILNLASNAADALTDMPGVLDVSVDRIDVTEIDREGTPELRPGEYAKLRVSDNGKGMDEKTMRRIFDPFFTTKDVGKGTGLGLATAYGIVTKHGGAIRVESALGRGSTFEVLLPVAKERAVDRPTVTVMENG